ncbi:tRNA epoxyqueuosine(34) reductase QueG [Pararobbsia silviterrae]|uniref:Epoxyqueuosine reductase n=1 Tax=Pararobbsia silviterrae TaxID=1792498 RepID=A0A494XFJ2_9BURK|nr:tRNA epoxyqueuosine(34) reductase QueG [Pararobbsia silviterrae]RKP48642.1 tRNA epoxyqueuosine(34) reductase QueG [Pararobbsia silviterrae]
MNPLNTESALDPCAVETGHAPHAALDADALATLAARIRQWGRELGFDAVGITDTDLSDAEQALQAWLAAGFHGEMDYMAKHGLKRARPAELVPGTLRVISLRMAYLPVDLTASDASGAGPERAETTRRPPGQPRSGWRAAQLARAERPGDAVVSVYARGRDYHKVLRNRLQKLSERIATEIGPFGYRVFTDSAPVLEVALAARADIGWRGKHTLLLERDAGSFFFLGEIFVDLPLPVDSADREPHARDASRLSATAAEPAPQTTAQTLVSNGAGATAASPTPATSDDVATVASGGRVARAPASGHCGSCTRCIDVCPTQAIIAPYTLDARRCISYLTIELAGSIPEPLRPLIGNRIYGCDDCQLVCPWNKFAQPARVDDFETRNGLDRATLLELWQWTSRDFEDRLAGTAIRRIGYERWVRNLAVGLGNAVRATAHGAQRDAYIEALRSRADDASPLIREHVEWALREA